MGGRSAPPDAQTPTHLLVLVVTAQQHGLLVIVLADGRHSLSPGHELPLIAQRLGGHTVAAIITARSGSSGHCIVSPTGGLGGLHGATARSCTARTGIIRVVAGNANAARVLATCFGC